MVIRHDRRRERRRCRARQGEGAAPASSATPQEAPFGGAESAPENPVDAVMLPRVPPNDLDDVLQVHDADGAMLGSIDANTGVA